MKIHAVLVGMFVLALVGCSSPLGDEVDDDDDAETAQAESEIKRKQQQQKPQGPFLPGTAMSAQEDEWSCVLHVTTWMLQATRNQVSYAQVQDTAFRNGARPNEPVTINTMIATLDVYSSMRITSAMGVSFDRVKAKAGRVAVGIMGAAWHHAVGVRGYDAERDALILANPQGGLRRLGRKDFAKLGSFAMVTLE